MRGKLAAGVLTALAFLIPATPAVADTAPPVLDAACQPVERQVFTDIRALITIDLDTATDTQVRVQAGQILYEANREELPTLPDALQHQLGETPADLRAFLKSGVTSAWLADLRVSAVRTLTDAGPNVHTAAQKALDDGTIDVLLAYLNDGLYAARALDCASTPTPTPTTTAGSQPPTTPSATTSSAVAIPTATADPGDGGGLPVTGSATGTVAAIGAVLLLIGGAGFLIGRRRRSRFVA